MRFYTFREILLMTLKETIAADRTAVFLNTDEFADSAVWTPAGGSAQPAVAGFYNNFPLHGDEYQDNPVSQPQTFFVTASSNVTSWKARDSLTVKSTTYEIINDPYPDENDNNWSIIELRLPKGLETRI
jgi:hypothetical protein